MEPEVYEFIQKQLPSQLMAANELLDASVTDVTATPVEHDTYAMMWNANLGVETLTQVDAGTYNLVFTIEGTVKDNLSSELGTQEIRVGKSHIVKTATFELEGGITPAVTAGGRRGRSGAGVSANQQESRGAAGHLVLRHIFIRDVQRAGGGPARIVSLEYTVECALLASPTISGVAARRWCPLKIVCEEPWPVCRLRWCRGARLLLPRRGSLSQPYPQW